MSISIKSPRKKNRQNKETDERAPQVDVQRQIRDGGRRRRSRSPEAGKGWRRRRASIKFKPYLGWWYTRFSQNFTNRTSCYIIFIGLLFYTFIKKRLLFRFFFWMYTLEIRLIVVIPSIKLTCIYIFLKNNLFIYIKFVNYL